MTEIDRAPLRLGHLRMNRRSGPFGAGTACVLGVAVAAAIAPPAFAKNCNEDFQYGLSAYTADGMSCKKAKRAVTGNRATYDEPNDLFTPGKSFELGDFKCKVTKQTGEESWKAKCRDGEKSFRASYGA